jgi:hypothetical protein
MIERKFSDLSKLTYRIFTLERKIAHIVRVTVMEWNGVYGDGSRGNDDGVFMRVTTLGALSAWHANAVVFDLRNLHYEWGDKIWEMFGRGIDPSGVEDIPYSTVVSEKCMPGFKTCISIIEPAFDTMEEAINDVVNRSHLRLVETFAELDGG